MAGQGRPITDWERRHVTRLLAAGLSIRRVAAEAGLSKRVVERIRARLIADGVTLEDASNRKPDVAASPQVSEIAEPMAPRELARSISRDGTIAGGVHEWQVKRVVKTDKVPGADSAHRSPIIQPAQIPAVLAALRNAGWLSPLGK